MISGRRLTLPLSAALLLAAAGSAYPWPSWVRNAIFAAGYYKHSRLTTLFSFNPADRKGSGLPAAGLTSAFGALIGTTELPAIAFQATPPAGLSKSWSVQKLATLNTYTATPLTPVAHGTVFGTEPNDVFMLTAGENGVKKTIAYTFTGGADGTNPSDGLTIGPDGALYGAATGGAYNAGVLYRLAPTIEGGFQQSVIYTFTGGTDGSNPDGSLAFDSEGRLVGSAAGGGNLRCDGYYYSGCGVLFRLEPGRAGEPWRFKVLHRFAGSWDGARPGDIAIDAEDNIFGATESGGASFGGTVYEALASRRGANIHYSVRALWNFTFGDDGYTPATKLAIDASGALYGTSQGGKFGAGTAFIVVPPYTPGGSWTFSVLHSFNGTDEGVDPAGGLLLDKAGRLYGTTLYGGAHNGGTIFRLVP
ncbi:MAG TPA: choice-of-anchor tandem repeat GloVer-containing protein [Acetobacteraceae bacterium]|nr:choice-of-anchor tandem repeat GloVer-containing protein [Acetobacteraceae bacterium]